MLCDYCGDMMSPNAALYLKGKRRADVSLAFHTADCVVAYIAANGHLFSNLDDDRKPGLGRFFEGEP